MSLPLMTSDDDVEAIVEYLITKPEGTTITEAQTILPRALLEDRKINAFVYWGVITKDGDFIKLNLLGKDISMTAPENRYLIYQKLIYNLKPYQSVLEWMFKKDFQEVTNIEVSSHWQMHFKSELGTSDENMMKSMATCFLQICQSAGFGRLTTGRHSQTNLFKIDKYTIGKYFTETISYFKDDTKAAQKETPQAVVEELAGKPSAIDRGIIEDFSSFKKAGQSQIFISHSENNTMMEQIKTMLDVEKINYRVAEKDDNAQIPVPDSVSETMRNCDAAIIFVSADDNETRKDGSYGINPDVLMEIGAAYALYNKKIVLLWDERITIPNNLLGIERCEFSGNELSWNAGVNLMKAVTKFRN
jgi:hypothetical protein